jgi:hypothetical protein
MKGILILIFTITLFVNCYGNPKENVQLEKIIKNDTIIREFQLFWENFRVCVLESNYKELEKKINFPLSVDGFIESYPQLKIYSNDFQFIFNIFLEEHTVSYRNLPNYIEFIKNISNMEEYIFNFSKKSIYIRNNGITIEMMEFEKIDSEWKLTQIYMDTSGLEEKIKEHRENINN